ncbi:MAG: hypothetical protein ACTSX9_01965 [Candidatus Njordarchaeales archaeon]
MAKNSSYAQKRRLVILVFSLIIMYSFSAPLVHSYEVTKLPIKEMQQESQIISYRVFNSSEIYVNMPVYLILVIHNPTTWILYNVTFWMLIPQNVKVLATRNDSSVVFSSIKIVREGTNVTSRIEKVDMNRTFYYWILLEFTEEGEYAFDSFRITFERVKGELKEKSSIVCPALTVSVSGRRYTQPPEGSIEAWELLLAVLVFLPLGFALTAHKIIPRKEK